MVVGRPVATPATVAPTEPTPNGVASPACPANGRAMLFSKPTVSTVPVPGVTLAAMVDMAEARVVAALACFAGHARAHTPPAHAVSATHHWHHTCTTRAPAPCAPRHEAPQPTAHGAVQQMAPRHTKNLPATRSKRPWPLPWQAASNPGRRRRPCRPCQPCSVPIRLGSRRSKRSCGRGCSQEAGGGDVHPAAVRRRCGGGGGGGSWARVSVPRMIRHQSHPTAQHSDPGSAVRRRAPYRRTRNAKSRDNGHSQGSSKNETKKRPVSNGKGTDQATWAWWCRVAPWPPPRAARAPAPRLLPPGGPRQRPWPSS